jgi:hypothetical protein
MATTLTTTRTREGGAVVPRATYQEDLITVGVGLWLTIGVFVDGWAHNTQGDTLESFFTPWHALFYSGFLACATWTAWLIRRHRTLPKGYALGALGVVIFGVGGLADMIWHTVFGIETDLKALLSPTHLMLFFGAFLILTSPLRAAWTSVGQQPTLRGFLPPLLSILTAASFTSFMLMFAWAPLDALYAARLNGLTERYGAEGAQRIFRLQQATGVDEVLITTVLMLAPLFFLMSRWRLPFGTATILLGVSGTLMQLVDQIYQPELIAISIVIGLFTDGLLRARPGGRHMVRVVGVAVPLVFWSLYYLAGQLRYGIQWPPEIWTGAIVLSMLSGVGLSVLASPPPSRTERSAE